MTGAASITRATSIQDFAAAQMSGLLTTLADRIHRAAKKPGPVEIHDLRVSIRRFSQGLQLFDEFYPKDQVKQIRVMLKGLMRLTSAIRDRDITLEYLAAAGHAAHQPRLEKERLSYQRQFARMLQRWSAQGFQNQWRSGLSLRNV
ncbi:MAG TPA: CHAD domain-containing protein [Bryobacteraceae bacterium]|nr:CHAD domain-containing protein [Bryobacteraceae bacterium]